MLWEFHFPEKEELKLRLKDMLEDQVDEKYYLSDKMIRFFKKNEQEQKEKGNGFRFGVSDGNVVAHSITTRAGGRMDDNFIAGNIPQWKERGKVFSENKAVGTICATDYKTPKLVQVGELDIKGQDCIKRVYSDYGLSPTLTDMQGGNRQPKIIASTQAHASIREDGIAPTLTTAMGLGGGQVPMVEEPFIVASRGRNPENPSSRKSGIHTEQRLEPNAKGITNTITSVQKDNYVATPEKSDLRIRKLTPKECWRLMGFHDDEFERAAAHNSNSQLYKQARKLHRC